LSYFIIVSFQPVSHAFKKSILVKKTPPLPAQPAPARMVDYFKTKPRQQI